jgi:CheY-like chemotaxis protein
MKPIIIAEDDYPARKIYVSIIEHLAETKVDDVENGRDLVEKVREGDYSLVFTDYEMPIMSGLKAVEEIRKFNNLIPICMMSASDIVSLKPEALKKGVTHYIDKNDNSLMEAIKSVISKYKK